MELGRSRWRARRRSWNRVSARTRLYIGDTPHDIACGKAIGAKTIAVATGSYSVEQLAALNPTHTFKVCRYAALLRSGSLKLVIPEPCRGFYYF